VAQQQSLPLCTNGGDNFGSLLAIYLKQMARHKTTSVYILPKNISTFHHPMKDELGLKSLGLYTIPHTRVQVYSARPVSPSRLV
jgi:hypothetical protein